MTIFTGIITSDAKILTKENKALFVDIIKKETKSEKLTVHSNKQDIFIGYNAQVTEESLYIDSSSNFTWISGQAIIKSSDNAFVKNEPQYIDYQNSHGELAQVLKNARGVFSGICVDNSKKKISLFSDKLGIRPIYVYHKDGLFIYSSLLSTIKALPFVDLTFNDDNTAVYMGLGFCLGNTTPYEYISRVDAGEIYSITSTQDSLEPTIDRYWSYRSDIEVKEQCTDDDIQALYNSFEQAVSLRSAKGQHAISFLSGGMDSRAITAMVNQYSQSQTTYNYSKEGSQDQYFARDYAKNAKLNHNEQSFSTFANPNWSMLMANSIQNSPLKADKESYKYVWSGDGGSVALGLVYITKSIEKSILDNDYDGAIKLLIEKFGARLPYSFLKDEFIENQKNTIFKEMVKEFIHFDIDPIKTVYFFLLYNDQKRHMDRHFETICHHGTELALPFFDSDFLTKICELPASELLYHKVYAKWFELFPGYVRATPWQTYPEHAPCPVQSSKKLSYQWHKTKEPWKNKCLTALSLIKIPRSSPVFKYFKPYKLAVALILHVLNIKDYSYILNKALKMNALDRNVNTK